MNSPVTLGSQFSQNTINAGSVATINQSSEKRMMERQLPAMTSGKQDFFSSFFETFENWNFSASFIQKSLFGGRIDTLLIKCVSRITAQSL